MELVLPDAKYKDSFIEAVKEYQTDDDDRSYRNHWYQRLLIAELEADFEVFVEGELSHARGENLREGYVPHTTYWLVDNGEFVGKVDVRHQLNDPNGLLMLVGGHIGYDIRPTERGKGYGNKILELVLPKAKELGIEKALLTCDVTNVASRKVIEKHGGILEDQIVDPETGLEKLRYWIDIP